MLLIGASTSVVIGTLSLLGVGARWHHTRCPAGSRPNGHDRNLAVCVNGSLSLSNVLL